MSTALCSNCASAVSSTARFCPRCGSTISSWTPPSAVDQQQQPPAQQSYNPQPQPYNQQPYQQPPYQQPPYQQPYQQQPYQQPYQQQYQQPYQQPYPQQYNPYQAGYGVAPALYVQRKDKTVAILLAIFLGFWTWLYTYQRDSWKFWVGLALNVIGIFLFMVPNIGVWIWNIIDVAVKPQQFYDQYPNG